MNAHLLDEFLLSVLNFEDLGLHGVLGDELVNVDILLLSDAVDAIDSLRFDPLLPPARLRHRQGKNERRVEAGEGPTDPSKRHWWRPSDLALGRPVTLVSTQWKGFGIGRRVPPLGKSA